MSPEFSGNAVLNPFSTAAVPVDPVEKEGGDPIENLLPALLQIFLTVRLDLHNISLPVKRRWGDVRIKANESVTKVTTTVAFF